MPTTALDGVMSVAVPLMQLVVSQIRMEADASWHAPVLQQSRVTWYQKVFGKAYFQLSGATEGGHHAGSATTSFSLSQLVPR